MEFPGDPDTEMLIGRPDKRLNSYEFRRSEDPRASRCIPSASRNQRSRLRTNDRLPETVQCLTLSGHRGVAVAHGHVRRSVPEEFLHGREADTVREAERRERVPRRVPGDRLSFGPLARSLQGAREVRVPPAVDQPGHRTVPGQRRPNSFESGTSRSAWVLVP